MIKKPEVKKGEMQTVMPWQMYGGMSEEDLGALFEYLRTVPPAKATHAKWTQMKSLIVAVTLVFAFSGCESSTPAAPVAGPNAIEIVVRTEPSGATVVIDGAAAGPSPATVKLNPGPHRLRASMSGYYPAPEAKIQVGASEPREHVLTLVASH